MCSEEELISSLKDLPALANLLKINGNFILSDSIFDRIAQHFLNQSITIEGFAVQRNLYGRCRSSSLTQSELDLLLFNIQSSLNSTNPELLKVFLQYLHNINRLLPTEYRDLSYLCAVMVLPRGNKNVLSCIICAYLDMEITNDIRFDLIINGLYENDDEDEDYPWIDQLTKKLIEKDKQWLRRFYLKNIYAEELLNAIDQHDKDKIFNIQPNPEVVSVSTVNTIESEQNTSVVVLSSSLNDLHEKLSSYVRNTLPNEPIKEIALFHLFSSITNYPDDLHVFFGCLLSSLIDPNNFNLISLRLFRRLINLINNYYVHQQDLMDDNRYRLTLVYLVCKFLCEIHRRRSNNEHEWYRLHQDIPKEHPLPTFDLFADLLCLLSTLTYRQIECQNQVRETPGTIEAILSMTQIDINQPKSQACVTWLLKCLTEYNEENRNYIKEIK